MTAILYREDLLTPPTVRCVAQVRHHIEHDRGRAGPDTERVGAGVVVAHPGAEDIEEQGDALLREQRRLPHPVLRPWESENTLAEWLDELAVIADVAVRQQWSAVRDSQPQAGTQGQQTAARAPRGEISALGATPQLPNQGSPGLLRTHLKLQPVALTSGQSAPMIPMKLAPILALGRRFWYTALRLPICPAHTTIGTAECWSNAGQS